MIRKAPPPAKPEEALSVSINLTPVIPRSEATWESVSF